MKTRRAQSAEAKQLSTLLKRRISEVAAENQLAEVTETELEKSVGGVGHTAGMYAQ
jgi:hypothetical protein